MLVKRDCFARHEIHRKRFNCSLSDHACSWCGNVKKTKKGKKYLFEYWLETDGGRKNEIGGLFCSNDCYRAYYMI